MSDVRLEQRKDMPKSSWDLPQDERYVRLGCAGCSNAVAFTARGTEFMFRTSAESTDLRDLIGEVGTRLEVQRGFTANIYDNKLCGGMSGQPCPEAETIDLVVELLNDRFNAELSVPGTT